jgi:aryl-alcohol dehydrogenase-like predicted oxidoreductase
MPARHDRFIVFPARSIPWILACVKMRSFGSTDLRVSELGFGCARIGGIFQAGSGGFVDLLHAAYDSGITFFDTSDIYSQGESETLIGRAFRGRRDRIVIASKAGYVLPGRRRLIARIKPLVRPIIKRLGLRRERFSQAVRGTLTQDFSTAYLERAVDASLRRLRTDHIDVYQLHSPSLDTIRSGAWLPALERLKRAGKVRYFGISVDSIEAGLAALEHPISSLQFVLNALEPAAALELLPKAREKGVACIARECLANGLLVKEDRDVDWSKYTSSEEQRFHRVQQLAELRARAAAENRSLPALSLDYVRNQDGISVTLVGASHRQQLLDLLARTEQSRAA